MTGGTDFSEESMRKLVLASGSPRRKRFFEMMGWPFEVLVPGTEERARENEAPCDYTRRNAEEKAAAALAMTADADEAVVVAADTIVVQGNRILEKPKDEEEAARMLRALSGHTHQVMSGVCVMDRQRKSSQTVITEVQFKELSDAEIRAYIQTGEPMDKAGAYGIQGHAAYMVRAIRGSYTNVVGLPLTETVEMLREFGF